MASHGEAAIGFSPHIGWAAAVALAGAGEAPELVGRARLVMATTFETGAVYHSARGLPHARAEARLRAAEARFLAAAGDALADLAADLRARGLVVRAGAVLAGSGRPLSPLEAVLRSHPLIHAAEGALYRRVVAHAAEGCGIPTGLVQAADLPARVARAAGLPPRAIAARLAAMGTAAGRPWTRDQKDAALAAWCALLGEARTTAPGRGAAGRTRART